MKYLICIALVLSACQADVNVVDKRIDPVTVANAVQTLAQSDVASAKEIALIKERLDILEKKKSK